MPVPPVLYCLLHSYSPLGWNFSTSHAPHPKPIHTSVLIPLPTKVCSVLTSSFTFRINETSINQQQIKMSGPVDQVTAALEQTKINDTPARAEGTKEAENEAHAASAAEGRRLYIGNLAYATTEDNLREFFKGYKM